MKFNYAYDYLDNRGAYDLVDAGLVAPQQEIRISEEDWVSASTEEIASLSDLPLYANQQYRVEQDLMTGDTLVHVRYRTPCITTLKEQK